MNAISDAIALIRTERNVKAAEISALTRTVEGLDIAISTLEAIPLVQAAAAQAEQPAKAEGAANTAIKNEPAAEPKTMASISAAIAVAGSEEPARGILTTLADRVADDFPELMLKFPIGPTVKDLAIHYGETDSRAREACCRLRDSDRAVWAVNPETGILHLAPRRMKTAA